MSDANRHIFINQLQPNMKNVNTVFIVLEVGAPRRTSQGNEVRTIRVADHTGSINMSVWNDLGEFVSPGDLYRVRSGCTTVHKGSLALSLPKSGEMLKTGEFLLAYSDTPDMSQYSAELDAKFPYRKGSPEEEKEDVSSSAGGHATGSGRQGPPVSQHPPGAGHGRPHPYSSHGTTTSQQHRPLKRPGQSMVTITANRAPVRVESMSSVADRIY